MKMRYKILIGVLLLALLLVIINPLKFFVLKMKIEEKIGINVTNEIPITATVTDQMVIKMLDKLQTTINVEDRLTIYLDEDIDVPLKMDLNVPLDTDIFMDEVLNLKFDLPIDVNLSPQELSLQNLVIPFNQPLKIEDVLAVDFEIPLDTRINLNVNWLPKIALPVKAVIPVKVDIPINQSLMVKDTIVLNPLDYNIRFKTIIPVEASVPIKQNVHIKGTLDVPVNQDVVIPLKKIIKAPVLETFNATVTVNNEVPVGFKSTLNATAGFSEQMNVIMNELVIDPTNVKISTKKKD